MLISATSIPVIVAREKAIKNGRIGEIDESDKTNKNDGNSKNGKNEDKSENIEINFAQVLCI